MLASFVRQETGSGRFHSFFTGYVLLRQDLDPGVGTSWWCLSTHRCVRRFCAKPGTDQTTWWVSRLPRELQAAPQSHAHLDYPGGRELCDPDSPLINQGFRRYKELVYEEKSRGLHCHCSIPVVSLSTTVYLGLLEIDSIPLTASPSFTFIVSVGGAHWTLSILCCLFPQQVRGKSPLWMKIPHAHKWQ